MRRVLYSVVVLLGAWLVLPAPASACPLCREAVPSESNTEERDQMRLARAYNNSIFLMLGMPYFLVGAVGFLVYRSLRQRAVLEQEWLAEHDRTATGEGTGPPTPGGAPCLPTSPEGRSSPAP